MRFLTAVLSISILSVRASIVCLRGAGCDGQDHTEPTITEFQRSSQPEIDQGQASHSDALLHANHIFNAIHNALKQWGNSLQHNGMSFFIATVKEGTELYHGTSSPYRVNGTEWLAFEPEHAMMFARPPWGGPHHPSRTVDRQQIPLQQRQRKGDMDDEKYGYFHTYRAQNSLRLLYVDGQSAAKSYKGTLDTQDVVLRNTTTNLDDLIGWDWSIAMDLCNQTQKRWQGRLDGIMRMEGGFEIILCDFERNLEVVDIHRVINDHIDRTFGDVVKLDYMRAIASRFDGLPTDKVSIDYEDNFVSMYAYPKTIHFNTTYGLPRILNSSKELNRVRADIDAMVLSNQHQSDRIDWQAVAELIVSRYAERIDFMANMDAEEDTEFLRYELRSTLRPFKDEVDRDEFAGINRCTNQFLPDEDRHTTSIAAQAVKVVSQRICLSLFHAADARDISTAIARIQSLKQWLGWADFLRKECRSCGFHEFCSVPIWPAGEADDLLHPHCISNDSPYGPGYWHDRD